MIGSPVYGTKRTSYSFVSPLSPLKVYVMTSLKSLFVVPLFYSLLLIYNFPFSVLNEAIKLLLLMDGAVKYPVSLL